jgi:hypothetical protein
MGLQIIPHHSITKYLNSYPWAQVGWGHKANLAQRPFSDLLCFSIYLILPVVPYLWQSTIKCKKSKAFPQHTTEALRGKRRYSSYSFLTSALGGSEVSVTPRPRFAPGERTTGTLWTGGWVGPRAGLDTEVRGKILCPCRGSNPDRPVVQSVVRHYTDWATPAEVAIYLSFNMYR